VLQLCNGTTNGRSAIMVSTIGEESFIDKVGSGVFETASDTVAFDAADADNNFLAGQPNPNNQVAKPWQDTSEPFLNEWELYDSYNTPTYVAGEPFIDFFNKGVWQGPDGYVESALCEGSLCSPNGASVAIGAYNVVILSGSHAFFTPAAPASFTIGNGASLTFRITDLHNQQMPAGTTVAATVASTAGSIQGPTSYTWPCATAVGGADFTFNIIPATTPGSGSLILTVTTPGNIVTTAFYTVND
jgi:hypothetical protein